MGNVSKYLKELFPSTVDTKNKIINGTVGSDTLGNGTTHPYQTIGKAVTVAQFPADLYLFESFTENVVLTNAKSNINLIGSKIFNKFKVELNGNIQTSSADTNNRFVRLGVYGINIKSGASSPVVLGSFDGGKHCFENVAFTTSAASLVSIPSNFYSADGAWLNFLNCDFSNSLASTLVLPDLDSTNTATLRLYNCGFVNISVGKGWTVYYTGDTVLNVVSKYSTALIVDLARCFRMNSIITSQVALDALIAITNHTADGAYLINFAGPTGITGIAAGDVILKNGSVHMITMKYADAPAQVIDFATNIVYIKKGTLWGSLGTAAYLDIGTTANKIVQLDANAKLPAVDGSNLTNVVASGLAPSVPYAVNSAKTDSNRYANFITKIDDSSVGFDTNSGSTPIKICYPDGSIETNNTLPNITGISVNGINYIVKEKGSNPYNTTLQPVESNTAPSSPATNQLWLDLSVVPAIPKKYNGSTWDITQFVKLGEFTRTAGVIGTPISYALNHKYNSGWFAVSNGGQTYTKNHNLGYSLAKHTLLYSANADGSNYEVCYSLFIHAPNSVSGSAGGGLEQNTRNSIVIRTGAHFGGGHGGMGYVNTSTRIGGNTSGYYCLITEWFY